jgi:four helix bundle protein
MNNGYQPIKSFRDLHVYQNLYKAMLLVHTKIVPNLPKNEKFDLADQMNRAAKGAPALVAEGFCKRYQKKYWHKYLEDAIGESNEMIHHLSVCIDVYPQYIDVQLCKEAIDLYDVCCRQLSKLDQSWQNFHERSVKK